MKVASGMDDGEGDRRRRVAKIFFDRAETVGAFDHFEYAIEMMLEGLRLDPATLEFHQRLREMALKRSAACRNQSGMFERTKPVAATHDAVQLMLDIERQSSYDPQSIELLHRLATAAEAAEFSDVARWANSTSRSSREDGNRRMQ